jgi:hypothetical protein
VTAAPVSCPSSASRQQHRIVTARIALPWCPRRSHRLLPAPAVPCPQARRGHAEAQGRPRARSAEALRREVDALRRENGRLAAQVAESRALTAALSMRRQRFTLALVGQLRSAPEASDPAKDAPALREALRDLGAVIEARHDLWRES